MYRNTFLTQNWKVKLFLAVIAVPDGSASFWDAGSGSEWKVGSGSASNEKPDPLQDPDQIQNPGAAEAQKGVTEGRGRAQLSRWGSVGQ